MTLESHPLLKLARKYDFALNPYTDARFTRCPGCEQKTKQRKFPLFIHVEPLNPIVLGKTCRYCPNCDLVIAHQDELEAQLEALFAETDPSLVGNDYLVMGTVEHEVWRESLKQPKGIPEMMEHLHIFKEVRTIEPQPAGWYPANEPPAQKERARTPGARPGRRRRKGSKRR